SIVGLSTNNRLCVVGETSAELAETNTSILQPLKANSKDASSRPRTQVERGLSNIEDEELPELLEVADLILQWLENQRKPKMTSKDKMISKDFARWLDEKGYAGNREEFLRVYESERQHKCQLRIAKTGSGRTKVPEAIKRQKKWIAALKAEQNARL
ncbi:hypothetical protein RESH_05429, partial [Rhodopirellula europaea SH398]